MSNTLAIGTVSAAIGQVIQDALDTDVPGATISYDRPGSASEASLHGTNIFLYQTLPSTHFRNADLPARSASGQLINRPCVSLDLNYLFTFYGDQSLFEPERMAASLARALHQTPVLGRDVIEAAMLAHPATLAGSDLGEAGESVKFTPVPLNLEELSKLWSILFQTSYKLSVAYRASVVQIESPILTQPALPVRAARLFAQPFGLLELSAIDPVASRDGITWGSAIRLRGRGLDRDGLRVRINGLEAGLDPAATTATEALLTLDAATLGGTLPAGILVAHLVLSLGGDAPAHLAQRSAPVAFMLRPRLTGTALALAPDDGDDDGASGTITATCAPGVIAGQDVRLLLNGLGIEAGAAFAPTLPADPVFPLTDLDFDFTGLASGSYLARIEIDGAQSPLAVDDAADSPTLGQFIGPEVVIP